MNLTKWLVVVATTFALVACGGGGGSSGTSAFGTGSGTGTGTGTGTGGTGTTPVAVPTIALVLSSSTVTSAAPVTATATVKDAAGAVVPNQVVTFSMGVGIGAVSASTALTNSAGQAVVTLTPAASTTVGADALTASVTLNGTAITASAGFQLTATNVTISSFTSDVGATALSAYGQTTLTVGVAGAATGASVNISLTSACVTAGKATLSPASTTTTTGSAVFIFKDTGGCGSVLAADALQATVTGASASRSLSLALTSPAVSSLTFVSASPETIFLKGSGYVATSLVTFKVVDVSNNPLPGQSISMAATTYTGGLTLDGASSTVTKTSDANGLVTVLVNSGTVPTPVRVKATLANGAISTSSSNLSIAVGLPTQNAFSLSQGTINIEGGNVDGTTNSYTVIASDRMGNPVPAGTSVNFVANGGQIVAVGQIALVNGLASTTVSFQSSDPRPDNRRITVVAYAIGEESFLDTNGNNVYDANEDFQDLGDVFVSRTFSPNYVSATDQRIPQTLTSAAATCVNATSSLLTLNASSPSAANFNGASRCDGVWGSAFVRRATTTVLSYSSARPLWLGVSASQLDATCARAPATLIGDTGAVVSNFLVGSGGLYGLNSAGGVISFIVADTNSVRLNPMAAGTTITVASSSNMTVTLNGGSPVPSTASATAASVSYTFTTGSTGTITLNFKSPGGLVTSYTVSVSTAAPATACTL